MKKLTKSKLMILSFTLLLSCCDCIWGPTITTTTTIYTTTTTVLPTTTTTTVPITTTTTISTTTTTNIPPTTTSTTIIPNTTPIPTGLRLSSSTDSSITLIWDKIPGNFSYAYKLYRIVNGVPTIINGNNPAKDQVNIYKWIDTGLSSNSTYNYCISAYSSDTGGDSPLSQSIKASNYIEMFKQTDPNWDKEIMAGVYTLHDYGCLVSDIAMVLKYYSIDTDPKKLNKWIRDNNFYNNEAYIKNIYSIEDYSNNKILLEENIDYSNIPADMTLIDNYLNNGIPVIAKVLLTSSMQHWIVITKVKNGVYSINDPYFSGTELNNNPNFKYSDDVKVAIYYIRVFK